MHNQDFPNNANWYEGIPISGRRDGKFCWQDIIISGGNLKGSNFHHLNLF